MVEVPVSSTRMMLAVMLMACAASANAECALNVTASNARPACVRWETARVLGAASVAGQSDTARESPVARSISELPWVDSSDWIRNPPQWLRDIKESRRRRAPVPVLHLWRSQQMQTLVALGVNRRGQPGLYIARNLPY